MSLMQPASQFEFETPALEAIVKNEKINSVKIFKYRFYSRTSRSTYEPTPSLGCTIKIELYLIYKQKHAIIIQSRGGQTFLLAGQILRLFLIEGLRGKIFA